MFVIFPIDHTYIGLINQLSYLGGPTLFSQLRNMEIFRPAISRVSVNVNGLLEKNIPLR